VRGAAVKSISLNIGSPGSPPGNSKYDRVGSEDVDQYIWMSAFGSIDLDQ